MTWHATGKCTEPGKMQYLVDGRAWKNFDTKYPNFIKEPRNFRLGLVADGFNPFSNLSQAYSIWSALKGVKTIDVAIGQKFNMKVMVLWTINDFPARSSLYGWSGQGYKACPTCNENTPSVHVRSLEFNGEIENGDPPRKFDWEKIQAQLARLPTRVKGKHPSYGGVMIKCNVLDVTMKFNRLDRNVDPPSPTYQFQVFRSLCKLIGLRSVTRFDAQELKKVIWYVLHNGPEIDTYRSQFMRSCQLTVDNNTGVCATNRDERLASTPKHTEFVRLVGRTEKCPMVEFKRISLTGFHSCTSRSYHWSVSKQTTQFKGTRKPNLGGRKVGRLHTPQETRNLRLKKITDDKGPGDSFVLPSWQKVPAEQKAAILTKIGTQFDLKPHMQSQRWTDINAGIQQHLQKLYNTNKASLKAKHWVINPETGTYDMESIRQRRPENITPADWDAQLAFWNDPRNLARAAQNRQNRAKSTVVCRQGSRSLARLRDQMMESSSTREYPSLIHTFFVTHTVGGVFVRDEDRALYDEMLRLQRLGSNTETGVPYTEEEIMAIVRKGKQRGHLPGVGRVLPGRATDGCPPPPQSTVDPADVEKLKKSNKSLTKQVKMMMRLFRSDDKFSQMLDQFESSPEFGGASGSGGCGDDEPGGDEDGDEDEEDGDS
ncbi:retrotransposon protein, putative, ty3-gypsy subclass [Tanacetum coccineum]